MLQTCLLHVSLSHTHYERFIRRPRQWHSAPRKDKTPAKAHPHPPCRDFPGTLLIAGRRTPQFATRGSSVNSIPDPLMGEDVPRWERGQRSRGGGGGWVEERQLGDGWTPLLLVPRSLQVLRATERMGWDIFWIGLAPAESPGAAAVFECRGAAEYRDLQSALEILPHMGAWVGNGTITVCQR